MAPSPDLKSEPSMPMGDVHRHELTYGQRVEMIMKHFRCGDIVPGCTRTFTGTENEILSQVAEHARNDHGMSDIPAELVNQVRSAMVPA